MPQNNNIEDEIVYLHNPYPTNTSLVIPPSSESTMIIHSSTHNPTQPPFLTYETHPSSQPQSYHHEQYIPYTPFYHSAHPSFIQNALHYPILPFQQPSPSNSTPQYLYPISSLNHRNDTPNYPICLPSSDHPLIMHQLYPPIQFYHQDNLPIWPFSIADDNLL